MQQPIQRAAGSVDGLRQAAVAAQHDRGKLTAEERVALLLDPASFEDIATIQLCGDLEPRAALADGLLAGRGNVDGRPVFVYAQDITFGGGAMSDAQARKIATLLEMALHFHAPIVGLFDSRGIAIETGLATLAAYGAIFRRAAQASGVIPRIALIMGPCVGADAFLAGLSDVIFMVRDESTLFVSGPEVVSRATGESVDVQDLGGASMHSTHSGVAAAAYDNDVEAILQLRRFVDFLPSSAKSAPREWSRFDDPERIEPSLDSLVPDDPTRGYEVKELIFKTVDEGDFFELGKGHAQNIVTGFGRIDGHTTGFVANQPLVRAGVLDCDALRKAARFIRFCGCFDIPLVTFIDTPGFLPGAAQEHRGLVKAGAKLMTAYAQAHVPKVAVVIRNAFGAAYAMIGLSARGGDVAYAWPSAQIGLIGLSGAREIFDRDGASEDDTDARLRAYQEGSLSASAAVASGLVDAVIAPHATRPFIVHALAQLCGNAVPP